MSLGHIMSSRLRHRVSDTFFRRQKQASVVHVLSLSLQLFLLIRDKEDKWSGYLQPHFCFVGKGTVRSWHDRSIGPN